MSKHVLVARLDSAGDVLLAGPAMRAVRAGARHVTMVCGENGLDAARMLEGVDDIVSFDAPWIDAAAPAITAARANAFVADIGGRFVDEAIVLTSAQQSPLPLALLLRMAGVPVIAGISDDHAGSLLNVCHRVDACHEVERNLSLVATLGFRLPARDDGRLRVRPAFALMSDERCAGRVVIHPGASMLARTLAPATWAACVDDLLAAGFQVAVSGGPTERALTRIVAGKPRKNVVDLGGQTNLSGLASMMAQASVVVCGNTGAAQLAAALGVPVVVAFAPTVPAERWRPWGVRHVLLGRQEMPCAGCDARVCPLPQQECLRGIRAIDVVGAVLRLLTDAPATLPALVTPRLRVLR